MSEQYFRRGQWVYDRWAEHALIYRVVDRLSRPIRKKAVRELQLDPGETVVDLGCGPGRSIQLLSQAVGADGAVLGVDYSSAMVNSASDQASNIPSGSILRGDAANLPIRTDGADGVFASLALSAMRDMDAVLDEIARIVRSDGRLVIVDGRVPDGAVGSILERIYRWLVNFQNPDLLEAVRTRFESVTVVETYDAGLGFVARVEIE